jgi:hypothetical protein
MQKYLKMLLIHDLQIRGSNSYVSIDAIAHVEQLIHNGGQLHQANI